MRPMQPIRINSFVGMSNVATKADYDLESARAMPHIILNMDNKPDGTLEIRGKSDKWLDLAGCHSVYSDGTKLFCVARGTTTHESVWIIKPDKTKTELCPIDGKGHRMGYVHVNNRLYISSKAWMGVYEYGSGIVRQWGVNMPDDPSILINSYDSTDLYTVGVKPPPANLENICLYGSRLWGSNGNIIYYSLPFAYEMFKDGQAIEFDFDIKMIAPDKKGIYVSGDYPTVYLLGDTPEEMRHVYSSAGAIEGTLCYGTYPKLGADIPMWASKRGIMAGINGEVINITEGIISYNAAGSGASLFHYKKGQPHFLSNFPQQEVGLTDKAMIDVFRKGKLI